MRKLAVPVVIGGVLALAAAACSSEDLAEEAIERSGGGDVDIDLDDVPDCFPDNTPVPDGTVQGGVGVGEGDAAVCTFVVDVEGTVAEVLDDYQAELEDAGYTTGTNFGQPGQQVLGMTKGDVGILVAGNQISGNASLSITAGTADVAGGTAPPPA